MTQAYGPDYWRREPQPDHLPSTVTWLHIRNSDSVPRCHHQTPCDGAKDSLPFAPDTRSALKAAKTPRSR